jgi:alpha-glucuronidase
MSCRFRTNFAVLIFLLLPAFVHIARAEDGSRLWLRYAPSADATAVLPKRIIVQGKSLTCDVIRAELAEAIRGLSGAEPVESEDADAIAVGTPDNSELVRALGWADELKSLGRDGFVIRSTSIHGRRTIVVASSAETGALYGAYHLLRLAQTEQLREPLSVSQKPRLDLRLINHWDNIDRSMERGYAGASIWKWDDLPGKLDPRYVFYARATASLGINGLVLNNVNAQSQSLSADYLNKAKALADLFRPYGIRVYLTANFAAPKKIGKLPTADPLDPQVIAWWKAKADEIYSLIPDFGGFLVKANSEGQPGPQDYKRTHADGANMLADALSPHGGIVMWRAFIYDNKDPDRAKRAYLELKPMDGKFRPNVVVQVKNGPVDFQPREPFHPLFGAMSQTRLAAELQIVQENLGQSKQLVYLAPMWKEFFNADSYANGPGSTVVKQISAIAGVSNVGSDANWCGHHFAQANFYAFGRLAWDQELTSEQIADEWLAQTFTTDAGTRTKIREMMMGSWEAFVSYSEPLGLHHWVAKDHYAPEPWHAKDVRPEYTATYYHHADASAMGYDRTTRGSDAVSQYFPPVRDQFDDVTKCPEKFLLWFHHVPWTHAMKSGKTLWEELCASYTRGAGQAKVMETTWQSLNGKIDGQRHREVAQKLAIQSRDAQVWRDNFLAYFRSLNRMPIPVQHREFDVVVYGGTSGGVTSAVQAARMGKRVALVIPGWHLGGMTSGGLGWTDIGRPEIIGGLARAFNHRVYQHYQSKSAWTFGSREKFADAPAQHAKAIDPQQQVMWLFEPGVAEKIFNEMARDAHVTLFLNERLDLKNGVEKRGGRITTIRTESGSTFGGKVFIDATYEGDLMAKAGVKYTIGREGNDVYGESINGIQTGNATKNQLPANVDAYVIKGDPTSGLLPGMNVEDGGSDGTGDRRIQAYCYRMCLTDVPENRVMIGKPEGYDEKQYELLFRAIEAGQTDNFFKFDLMPNRKTDSNNASGISTDFIGMNYAYPDGDYVTREKIAKAQELWQRGLLWTLQNHPRVPREIRDKYAGWGLPKDEFTDTNHWPHQLYVREARRMVSDTVVTERAVLEDSAKRPIALGGYSMDSHNVQRYVDREGHVRNEGDVQIKLSRPYRIDYGAIVPKSFECTNLFVTFCVSASHAAFSTIRMEPVFMELGQCAGTAACIAIDEQKRVQDVPFELLQRRLLADAAVLDWNVKAATQSARK